MDIAQAQQEIQRLRRLYESRQITPEAFAQVVSQLQIVDANGGFWHVDGASLRWYRYDGQNWVEQSPPQPPAPPPPVGHTRTPPNDTLSAAGSFPARRGAPGSRRLLWMGLGTFLVILAAAAGAYWAGAFQPGKRAPQTTSAAPAATHIVIQPAATQAPAGAPIVSPAASVTVARTAAVQTHTPSQPAPAAETYLPADGPWLVSKDKNNLYLVGASLTTQINTEPVVAPVTLEAMIAPKGGYLAFITSPDPDGIRGLKLNIYNLAARKTEMIIALTSATTDPGANPGIGPNSFEAARAIIEYDSLAWSPDGRRLAFIGVQDGPSSDLYLVSLDTQKVTRLTDGPSQAFAPSWSPDGKYIVQFGAINFGTGAGITMAGAWATQADTGVSTALYTPTSFGEVELGWANANTVVVYSFNVVCVNYDLRLVTIQPLKVTTIFSGCFSSAAFDPASGSIVLGIIQGEANLCYCGKKVDGGLYLVGLDSSLKRLSTEDVPGVAFLKNAAAVWGYTGNGDTLAFTLAGKALTMPAGAPTGPPLVATGGKTWAWLWMNGAPGLWVGAPEGKPAQVTGQTVTAALWSENGETLFFLSGTQLYAAAAPGYQAVLLGTTSAADAIAWVEP